MVPRETVSFVFPRVSGLEGKQNYFPDGPFVKCFVIYLDFASNKIWQKQTSKDGTTGARVKTAQLYPGRVYPNLIGGT